MTLKIIMLIAAAGSGLLCIANAIGGEIARFAEDTQEYPSCDNCVGSVDSSICKF